MGCLVGLRANLPEVRAVDEGNHIHPVRFSAVLTIFALYGANSFRGGNADRAYNTLHFASQSRVPKGCPLWEPAEQNGDILPLSEAYRRLLSAVRFTVCV